jgi:ribosomal protein S24E
MEIIDNRENTLLNRKEVKLQVEAVGNLGFSGAEKVVAEEFKAKEDVIAVRNIYSNFGSGKFLIEAFIYGSKEHKELIEPKPKKKKKAGGA